MIKLYQDYMGWLDKLKSDIQSKHPYEDPLDYNLDQIQNKLETVKYECQKLLSKPAPKKEEPKKEAEAPKDGGAPPTTGDTEMKDESKTEGAQK